MDAARLVAEAERAMRGNPQPQDLIEEAWQAYELTEAVARLLSAGDGGRHGWDGGPAEEGTAPDHGRPGVRAGPAPVVAAGAGPSRAVRLTVVRDAAGTLRALRTLLGELGPALVALVCTAEDEAAYWQGIEALDAVDEAKDRVRTLTRTLPG